MWTSWVWYKFGCVFWLIFEVDLLVLYGWCCFGVVFLWLFDVKEEVLL